MHERLRVSVQVELAATGPITALSDGYRRLAQVLHELVSEQSVDAILTRIATDLGTLVPCDEVVIWELSGDTVSVGYADGEDGPQMRGRDERPL